MQKLIAGLHKFLSEVFPQNKDLFDRLSRGQSPETLFITCSDSRLNPHLFTQSDPGELFVVRNAGNIVPPTTAGITGEAASIEFAVAKLGVKHIVVCGHTECGAMKGLLDPKIVEDVPAVRGWLEHAHPVRRLVLENYGDRDAAAKVTTLVEENVLAQLENLRTHPSVKAALERGQLSLYGWVYKIATGEVFQYSPQSGQFEALSAPSAAMGAPAAGQTR